jgi:uncharacterized cupredoxin-like copper-binding protein
MPKAVILVCLAAAAAAPAGTARGDSLPTLRADVAEWSIVPSSGAVPAGRVRIEVRNLGAYAHEVVLVRTRSFAAPLPLRANRAVVTPVARTRLLRAGERASFVVTLRPGSYVLLDNLPWHYWKGTSAAFSVR